jgi:hypothetical protein
MPFLHVTTELMKSIIDIGHCVRSIFAETCIKCVGYIPPLRDGEYTRGNLTPDQAGSVWQLVKSLHGNQYKVGQPRHRSSH